LFAARPRMRMIERSLGALLLMSHLLANIGPKLTEKVACEPPRETQSALGQRSIDGSFAVNAPCIRNEIFAENPGIARVSWSSVTVAAICQDRHGRGVADTVPQLPFSRPIVTWIFLPNGPQSRFDRVTHDNLGKPHAVPLRKTRDMRP